ncbi:hypothetical protein KKB44_04075 [Candidatus Micrarchaeota archaeon]|nr:hypothetical protein [Candidatus Micrarchaeota archaeon]
MELVPRGLFNERKGTAQSGKDYFTRDIRTKILMLFDDFDLNHLDTSSVVVVGGSYRNSCLRLMKSKLKYLVDLGHIDKFEEFFLSCTLNELLSCVELYTKCMEEIISRYEQHERTKLYSRGYDTSQLLVTFVKSFNNLLAYHKIPYHFVYNDVLDKLFIEKQFNEVEEEVKEKIYEIIKNEPKINEYFTQSLGDYAKREYKVSIENAYLTLEKYLKVKTKNHNLDAVRNFVEFQKKYSFNEKGIFSVRPDIIKNKISLIYSIRSELKSHSDRETFDTNKFLEETAKFQLNEVMNCILILEDLSK